MRKSLLTLSLVVVVLVGIPSALAKVAAPPPVAQRAILSDVVVIGKVTAVEKEAVKALLPYQGATDKIDYQLATVKIESGLIGADKLKEIKVGFYSRLTPPTRRGYPDVELKLGQEYVLFLKKHPTADFHVTPERVFSFEVKDASKADLDAVKTVAAVLADPMKALKSDKPETRAEAATIIILKHRQYEVFGGETEQVAIGADESKLLLKALTEGNWSLDNEPGNNGLKPFFAARSLNLTDKEGWVEPVIVNTPGAPPVDFGLVQRDAFKKWLDGPGKDYKIKRIVLKTKK